MNNPSTPITDIKKFWDRAASGNDPFFSTPIEFTDPFNLSEFAEQVDKDQPVLDFGCGYGRIMHILQKAGFTQLYGVDISSEMLARAKKLLPALKNNVTLYDGKILPFADNTFNAITSFAVLNAISSKQDLDNIFTEFKRVLKPGGIFYLCEFMIAPFARDKGRYDLYKQQYPNSSYGTFRHASGIIMKHYASEEIDALLSDFDILWQDTFEHVSMSGNPCILGQWIARHSK